MLRIKVLYFGMARDVAGQSSEEMNLDGEYSVESFKKLLCEKYIELNKIQDFSIAANESYAEDHYLIQNNDTLAIIPPVSGG